ncbi:MAG: tetratricopeptide repeat protein [Bacteroidetes bacterium]|nr:tetratricopeptide repeat protein [Bacteroidota bacterium]
MENYKDLFLQAYDLYTKGETELAIHKLNEAERLYDPEDSPDGFNLEDLFILRGTIHFSTNNLEQAKSDFERALKENNSSSEACLGLGQYFIAKGLFENAKTMFEWAVKNNPEHPGAQKALANVNSKLNLSMADNSLSAGNNQPAKKEKSDPLDEAAELFAQKKYKEALTKLFETRKQHEEVLASIENFIAFNYLELNDDVKTKEAAERALKLNPFSSQAYATLGEIYFREKNNSAAKTMFEIALKHNPENNFARTGLQNVEQAMGITGGNGKAHNLHFSNSY